MGMAPDTVDTTSRVAGCDGDIQLLVVDDDAAIRETLADWLGHRQGVQVHAFASAEEVVAHRTLSDFAICLLDYRLRRIDGLTLGSMIRAANPEARVVLMSGLPAPGIERLAFEHGFRAVLQKPVSLARLGEVLFEGAGSPA
jgi:DNA-binding NtrC family response regulator